MIEMDDRHEKQRTRQNSWPGKQPSNSLDPRASQPLSCPEPAVCGCTCLDALSPWLLGQAGPTLKDLSSLRNWPNSLRQPTALGQEPTLPVHSSWSEQLRLTPLSRGVVASLAPKAPSGPSSSRQPAGVGRETAPPPPHPPLCLCPKAAG